MNTKRYIVQIWKSENRIDTNGADYDEVSDAYTAEEAAKKILEAKYVSGKFYVEVRPEDDKVKCWAFTDMSPELNS